MVLREKGSASAAGMMDGWNDEEWKDCARNPFPALSSRKDMKFFGEAWKNQAAFGRAGIRAAFPPKPSEKPNGSFHRPKPQVPGKFSSEARARKLKVRDGWWRKCHRRREE